MVKWKPISTAPKDGKEILIVSTHYWEITDYKGDIHKIPFYNFELVYWNEYRCWRKKQGDGRLPKEMKSKIKKPFWASSATGKLASSAWGDEDQLQLGTSNCCWIYPWELMEPPNGA